MTLSELYERHAQDVYRFSFWLTGNAADAEDITSETFVRAWVGTTSFEAATVKAYLFTIARNLFLQQRRRERPRAELSDELEDRAPAPDVQAESYEELSAVHDALMRLPEVDRTALVMRVDDGMPYDDIARALSISVSSAKVKVHRARLKLAEILRRRTRHESYT